MSKPKSWILHGPQGTGKTQLAPDLARLLGLERIVDEWAGAQAGFRAQGVLYCCCELPAWAQGNRRAVHVHQARQWVARATAA